MVSFITQILKFDSKGEKTGWTYIEVPADIANLLIENNKKSFRVRGFLDQYPVNGLALLPMGEGAFILALNGTIRKGIHKNEGAMLSVQLEVDVDYKVEVPAELDEYLAEDTSALEYFNSLAKSHRDYFIKWIESAKTEATRQKRIVETAKALSNGWDYGKMIRSMRLIK